MSKYAEMNFEEILFLIESVILRRELSPRKRATFIEDFMGKFPVEAIRLKFSELKIFERYPDEFEEASGEKLKKKIRIMFSTQMSVELLDMVSENGSMGDEFVDLANDELDNIAFYIGEEGKSILSEKVENKLADEVFEYNELPKEVRTDKGKNKINRLMLFEKIVDKYDFSNIAKSNEKGHPKK